MIRFDRPIREVVVDPEEAHQHRQHFLVVRENPKWPRALAVVELLSPANKTGKYAGTYNAKRAKMLASLMHFMEIDMLRGGDNPLRRHFPDLTRTPYFVFVARKTVIGRSEEGYPVRLQDELPVVGLMVRKQATAAGHSGAGPPGSLPIAARKWVDLKCATPTLCSECGCR